MVYRSPFWLKTHTANFCLCIAAFALVPSRCCNFVLRRPALHLPTLGCASSVPGAPLCVERSRGSACPEPKWLRLPTLSWFPATLMTPSLRPSTPLVQLLLLPPPSLPTSTSSASWRPWELFASTAGCFRRPLFPPLIRPSGGTNRVGDQPAPPPTPCLAILPPSNSATTAALAATTHVVLASSSAPVRRRDRPCPLPPMVPGLSGHIELEKKWEKVFGDVP